MRKLTQIVSLVLVLSLAFINLSFAEIKAKKLDLSLYGGYLLGADLGSDTAGGVTFTFGETDNAFGGGGSLAYNFTENWAAEASVSYWPSTDVDSTATDGTSTVNISTGMNQLHLFLNGVYHVFPENDIVPYLTAGIGMVRFSGEVSALGQTIDFGENDLAFNVGGGVKWFFSDAINLRAEAKDVISSMEGLDTMHMPEFTVGLGITF